MATCLVLETGSMSGTSKISLELTSSEPARPERGSGRMSSKELLERASRLARRNNGRQERCIGCRLLGFRGLVCLFLSTAIGGLLIYAYSQFVARPWYILVCGILALCMPLKFIILLGLSSVAKTREGKAPDTDVQKKPLLIFMEMFNAIFDPDGKYYLSKTYASELAEYIGQIFAVNVYACSFPVWLTNIFYVLLAVEALGITFDTFWTMKHGLTVQRRNNRVMVDIVLEVLSSMIPLLILRFGYKLEFTELEFAQIALIPAVFAWQKIYEIVEAVLRERAIQYHDLKNKNKRLSFFQESTTQAKVDENETLAQEQMKHTPRWLHLGFSILSLVYGVYLLILVVGQLILAPSVSAQCSVGAVNKKVWDACEVKVPFCKNFFSPSCDCAVLKVHHHNWTALPDMVGGMTALKTIVVNDGPLERLSGMAGLTKLRTLNFNFNHLEHVPDELGRLHVTKLELAFNRLDGLPLSIWSNPHLVYLGVSSNNISRIEHDIPITKSLQTLLLANNSLRIFPQKIITQLTSLEYLYLDGNNIATIPSNICDLNRLLLLGLHNNPRIREVPKAIGGCINLKGLDIRNNNISSLPNEVEGLKRLHYIYMENNPICSNGWMNAASNKLFVNNMESRSGVKSGCSQQCSRYCQSYFLKNYPTMCLNFCNSEACEYQNGACMI